ncbi:GMC oxidoreductase [Fulvimarina sp. MAC3]|uniref:GMC oxidoreductase n=1 Tax=Fulvimarina sp. MAC3 TaxID=3148887 RepID=UPI0031FD6466
MGAGVAGIYLTVKLASMGYRVILLESGGEGLGTDELNTVVNVEGCHKWGRDGRARGLGGSSLIWGRRMIPMTRSDLMARDHIGAPAWPISYDDLLAGLSSVESFFGLGNGSYDNDTSALAPNEGSVVRAFESCFIVRRPKWAEYRGGNAWRIAKMKLARFRDIEVWTGATVLGAELDADKERIAAISARSNTGRRLSVQAEYFILAAGGIETTRLLLQIHAESGGRVFEGCDALGRYFHDHLDLCVHRFGHEETRAINLALTPAYEGRHRRSLQFEMSAALQASERVASMFFHVTADTTANPTLETLREVKRLVERRQVTVGAATLLRQRIDARLAGRILFERFLQKRLYFPQDTSFRLRICAEQSPRYDNRLLLSRETDRMGMRKVGIVWRPGPEDERTLRIGVDKFEKYWNMSSYRILADISALTRKIGEDEPLIAKAQDYAHPSGGTRMGIRPTDSVVDADLVCHKVPNLGVVSSSTFPSSGSANPTLTIALLADYAARMLPKRIGAPAR